MFSVRITDDSLKKCEQTVRDSFKKVIQSETLAKDLATTIITDVKFQTRKTKFKPLSEKWIKERKQISKATKVNEAFSPRRSNLTITGQLLDSLKLTSFNKGKYVFEFVGDHQPYKAPYVQQYKRGKTIVNTNRTGLRTIGKAIKNEDLAKYVQEQGREFIKLRKSLIPRLRNLVVAYIRRSSRVLKLFK